MFSPPHLKNSSSSPSTSTPQMAKMSASPAKIEATPTHEVVDPMAIFDVLSDPRKTIPDIESFVLSNPSCLGAISIGNGCTPLHEAARRGNSRLIQFFVDSGAVLEVRGNSGETPFLVACDVSNKIYILSLGPLHIQQRV